MSVKLQKWNKYNWSQERYFVITTENVYNFNKKKLRRVIAINNLEGLTKNLSTNSKEFVLHVKGEADYRLSCDQ